MSRIDTQAAKLEGVKAQTALVAPSSVRSGSTTSRSEKSSAPGLVEGMGFTKMVKYTRDGRRIDNSMRSEEESVLIERVQGHSTLTPPSVSHPSVAKFLNEDGTPAITPRSTSITPRSVSLGAGTNGNTPRSARSASDGFGSNRGVTPRSARAVGTDGAILSKSLSPAAFGLAPAAPPQGPRSKSKGSFSTSGKHAAPGQPGGTRGVPAKGGKNAPNPISVASHTKDSSKANAPNRENLEALAAAARLRRQAMAKPMKQKLAASLGSAAECQGTSVAYDPTFDSNLSNLGHLEWRDDTFRRTHIDYRNFLKPYKATSLHDLQNGAITMPTRGNGATQGLSSVSGVQGSTTELPRRPKSPGLCIGGPDPGLAPASVLVHTEVPRQNALMRLLGCAPT